MWDRMWEGSWTYKVHEVTQHNTMVTYYLIETEFDTFGKNIFWECYGKWSICSSGANSSFSIILSKVLNFSTLGFQKIISFCLNIENDVII